MAVVIRSVGEPEGIVMSDVFCPSCHRAIGPTFARCSVAHVRACREGDFSQNQRWADAVARLPEREGMEFDA
jgi:hypothetical protein